MRFLADENIAPSVVATLRKDGHDVVSIFEESPGVSDEAVLSRGFNERRIVLTHDRDLGNILRYPVASHAGVILLRLRDQRPASVIEMINKILDRIPARQFEKRLVLVNEFEVRFVE